jgi:hypothetical protein
MRTVTHGLTALLLGTMYVGGTTAQQPDVLQDARQQQEVEAQRIQIYVDKAIEYANILARQGRLAEAAKYLQYVSDEVKNNPGLPETKREKMLRSLSSLEKQYDTERRSEARRSLNPFTQPQPNVLRNPGDRLRLPLRGSGTDAIDYQRLREQTEAERRFLGLQKRLDFDPLPLITDMPSGCGDVPARTRTGNPTADPDYPSHKQPNHLPTERENAILKQLNTMIRVDFRNDTFKDVIEHLQQETGQPIVVDQQAMKEANVTYEASTVTLKVSASTRSVLKKTLVELGLTYVIKDESIHITTPARARDMMSARVYAVDDLAGLVEFRFGPGTTPIALARQVNELMARIRTNILPETWEKGGGAGVIYFDQPTMMFVVRQSAEVHFLLSVRKR